MRILLLVLLLAGCTDLDPFSRDLKCVDGVVYVKSGGAWIQAMLYKDNKCLPESK